MTIERQATTFDHGVRAFRPRDLAAGRGERHDTVVIGAGQAGLSAGYHLARRGIDFVILDEHARILDEHARVGDGWRTAWDSLRLFTPSRYNGLPGMDFPATRAPMRHATRWPTTCAPTPSASSCPYVRAWPWTACARARSSPATS